MKDNIDKIHLEILQQLKNIWLIHRKVIAGNYQMAFFLFKIKHENLEIKVNDAFSDV